METFTLTHYYLYKFHGMTRPQNILNYLGKQLFHVPAYSKC